jgi:hypothetical protein
MQEEEKLKCSICGRRFVKVCAHVWLKHKIPAREYKIMMGYDVKKGLITKEHKEVLRQHSIDNGMPKRLRLAGVNTRYKKGESNNYQRSTETLERLRKNSLGKLITRKKKVLEEKICVGCKGIFLPKYIKKKYCSMFCYQKYDPISKRN